MGVPGPTRVSISLLAAVSMVSSIVRIPNVRAIIAKSRKTGSVDTADEDAARIAPGIDRKIHQLRRSLGLAGGATNDHALFVSMIDGATQRVHLGLVAHHRLYAEADGNDAGLVAVDRVHDGAGEVGDALFAQQDSVGDTIRHDGHGRADAGVFACQVSAQHSRCAGAVARHDSHAAGIVQRIARLGRTRVHIVAAAIDQQGGKVGVEIENGVVGEAGVEMTDQDATPIQILADLFVDAAHGFARAHGVDVPGGTWACCRHVDLSRCRCKISAPKTGYARSNTT